ncbi:hypothetical protein R1flu_019099 [Riccia fluitans]|uniref:Uncharacterized protein n=1 Tax=Riccia fluitans TaxID=41844 RepID=A0ABD1ZHP3_9MARC
MRWQTQLATIPAKPEEQEEEWVAPGEEVWKAGGRKEREEEANVQARFEVRYAAMVPATGLGSSCRPQGRDPN